MSAVRTIGGRVMIWHGHRVERTGSDGEYRYQTLCGVEDVPRAWLSCREDAADCMACALALDAEKLP